MPAKGKRRNMTGVADFLDALNDANGSVDEGIYNYKDRSEVPNDILKYWHQRHRIFSKYDDGIWMTDSAWYGVTPEPVALLIAEHIAQTSPPGKTIIVDAFGGAGGNAIAFALGNRWRQVFCIEKDPATLKCARHNARLYGVDKKIVFIQGDAFQVLPQRFAGSREEAVIFASPPWGGVGYSDDAVFDLEAMEPYNLRKLHAALTKITKEVALYLPRNSNLNQLARYVEDGEELQVMHYCIRGASKALCAYYGDFLRLPRPTGDDMT